MRKIYHSIIMILLMSLSMASYADQYDVRLDDLFNRLQTTRDEKMAILISEDIWNIWSRHNDENVSHLFRRGEIEMKRGNYQHAIQYFDQVIEIAPDFAEAWNKHATVNYQAGNYRASLNDISETLKLEPRHFGALMGRGMCYMKLDRWQKALESFQQALLINPWLKKVRENIIIIQRTLKQSI